MIEQEYELLLLFTENRPDRIGHRHDGGLATVAKCHQEKIVWLGRLREREDLAVDSRHRMCLVVIEVEQEEVEVITPCDRRSDLPILEHWLQNVWGYFLFVHDCLIVPHNLPLQDDWLRVRPQPPRGSARRSE